MNSSPSFTCNSLATSLSFLYGAINAVTTIVPESANSLATSPIRLIFSFRSSSENPRSLFNPKRMLSPSKRYAVIPLCSSACSNATAIVDFPEADSPVIHIVNPGCPRSFVLSGLVTLPSWKVMFVAIACQGVPRGFRYKVVFRGWSAEIFSDLRMMCLSWQLGHVKESRPLQVGNLQLALTKVWYLHWRSRQGRELTAY